jgi:CheY-like chemotaxis protein
MNEAPGDNPQTQHESSCIPVRVLIVEDEFIVALSLRLQLEGMGYEVSGIATSPSQGIEAALELRPDIVLMDLALREGSGLDATKRIVEDTEARVIVVTAYSDYRLKQAEEAGASLVLTKPIAEAQLGAALQQVLGTAVVKDR